MQITVVASPTLPVESRPMASGWFSFGWNILLYVASKPGVYEVSDKDGKVIYVGAGSNLRNCVERLIKETDSLHRRQNIRMCRIEYREEL